MTPEPNPAPDLVVSDPETCHGQARIAGTRIPVSVILDNLAAGVPADAIRDAYPTLPEGAVEAALRYAARLAREELRPIA